MDLKELIDSFTDEDYKRMAEEIAAEEEAWRLTHEEALEIWDRIKPYVDKEGAADEEHYRYCPVEEFDSSEIARLGDYLQDEAEKFDAWLDTSEIFITNVCYFHDGDSVYVYSRAIGQGTAWTLLTYDRFIGKSKELYENGEVNILVLR